MKKIMSVINGQFEAVLSSIFLIVMTGIIAVQIFCRILGLPLSWTEELALYTFVWLIYISCSYAIKKRAHIKLDLLRIFSKAKGKLILDVIANMGFLIFSTVLTYWCIASVYRLKEVNYQVSPAVGFPMWIANLALAVGFVLMVYRLVCDTVLLFREYGAETMEGGVSK